MAVTWLVKGEPLAALDDVDAVIDVHTSPKYAPVREKYKVIDFEVLSEAEILRVKARAARDAFLEKDDAEDHVGGAQEDVRQVVEEFEEKWIRPLTNAVAFALRRGHPDAEGLRDLVAYERLDADQYRGARYVAEKLVNRLRKYPDLASLRLPADFLARGEGYVRRLPEERSEANIYVGERALGTQAWHRAVDALAESLELWVAARAFAQDVTGEPLPPITMPFSRTAAGNTGGKSDPEPET